MAQGESWGWSGGSLRWPCEAGRGKCPRWQGTVGVAPRGHQRSGHVVEQGAVRGQVAVAMDTVSCGLSSGSGRRVTSVAPGA